MGKEGKHWGGVELREDIGCAEIRTARGKHPLKEKTKEKDMRPKQKKKWKGRLAKYREWGTSVQ